MAEDNRISMPGAFGGLMRYDEEVGSRFKLTPVQAIGFVVLVLVFVLSLKMFWPIAL